ncbi:MAG: hypothetical protein QM532_02170 [Cyanobium sp. MAG06]|nr:hypothetical protein [Cyanobium sp. MAG06]
MFDVILNQYLSDPNLIYWTVLITIFVNGIINTPSSQVIYLGAGYLASVNNNVSLILLVIVGGIANAVSNLILHLLIRKYHIKATDYIGKFFKLNQDDIEYYKSVAKEKGAIWLIMSKTIPGIKVYTPLITGLINMKNLLSFVIFLIGSII